MADCNDLFKKFQEKITLISTKRDYLKQARDALRKRIIYYFVNDKEETPPEFWIQGSYKMLTIVNPLDGEYDIDDGIYLQNIDSDDKDNWPKPETVHDWIVKAVQGHTEEDPIDKRACVRVVYSGNYHVDLPIYGVYQDETYLAEKGEKGWHLSDPKALIDWFTEQTKVNGELIKKTVKYLKAWSDNKAKQKGIKLPNGLILTVLVVEGFEDMEEDDVTFGRTIRNISNKINDSFIVYNPIDKEEILSERLTDTQKEDFKLLISELLDSADKALGETSKKKACKIWREEFGDRFPNCDDIEDKLFTSSPALLRDDSRSA